jgi:acyl-coenzyme A thioesterase PaaI-like protein
MLMNTLECREAARQRLEHLRLKEHPDCFVCGQGKGGLGLRFELRSDSSVEATFDCIDFFQGYSCILHGGIISSMLDAAMTHCLFAQGEVAFTAELVIQFKRPVSTRQSATISARMQHDYCPLFVMQAELVQNGFLAASATGKFMRRE